MSGADFVIENTKFDVAGSRLERLAGTGWRYRVLHKIREGDQSSRLEFAYSIQGRRGTTVAGLSAYGTRGGKP